MTKPDKPAKTVSEIRFKIALATLPQKLQDIAMEFTLQLFRAEHLDYRFEPTLHPSFYEIGDIVLFSLATRLPEVIKPFEENPRLECEDDKERLHVIKTIKKRCERVLQSRMSFRKKHAAIFNELEHVLIAIHNQKPTGEK